MKTIGSIGLGAMGGSYAKFLIEDNYTVYGVDPDTQNAEIFTSLGGLLLNNIRELVDKSNFIILSLPTVPIFKEVADKILEFREEVGDFGTLLYAGHDWADVDLAKNSMKLMAEKVMPKINKHSKIAAE